MPQILLKLNKCKHGNILLAYMTDKSFWMFLDENQVEFLDHVEFVFG